MTPEEIHASADERVAALADYEFDAWVAHAKESLDTFGYAFVSLSPGDMTNYKISIVRPISPLQWRRWELAAAQESAPPKHPSDSEYFMAHSFGPLYAWDAQEVSWDYVYSKWTPHRDTLGTDAWTARILARFLNKLSVALKETE